MSVLLPDEVLARPSRPAKGNQGILIVGVDKLLLKLQGHTHKSMWQRVIHAIGFEGGLLLAAMPIMSLWLGITLLEAFFLDLGFAIFYLVYAFVYNLSYDKIFPIPREVPHGMPQGAR